MILLKLLRNYHNLITKNCNIPFFLIRCMQYQMANGLMQYQLTVKAATNRQLMKNGEELLRNNYAVNGFNTRP